MNPERQEIYQSLIIDHDRRPRNFNVLAEPTHSAEGHNPVCGDRCTVYLRMDDDRIVETSFQGYGCAISKASASMMTSMVTGRSVAEAEELIDHLREMLLSREEIDTERLGDLAALAGVRQYPVRVKCATLAWHTLRAAIHGRGQVSTE